MAEEKVSQKLVDMRTKLIALKKQLRQYNVNIQDEALLEIDSRIHAMHNVLIAKGILTHEEMDMAYIGCLLNVYEPLIEQIKSQRGKKLFIPGPGNMNIKN